MTLIELSIVMSIVSILLALVLGLARHVDTAVKIRRAQADLAEWHESIQRWFLQFGEYPHAGIDTTRADAPAERFDTPDWSFREPRLYPLAILTNDTQCFVHYDAPETNITFRSLLTASVSTVDPWGTPYIYIPSENAKAYALFSCGPNRQTMVGGQRVPTSATATALDPTLDDINFER